ncbi:hypothetical protein FB472_1241 [Rhodoglobus vestalii]|uniref:Uncharacterized protein n=1 Tax=Rhodoglobus vestalii TaxID=193384 RepID=A0A8H2K5R3_9MICO|nr:hypothetical protein [Rhodoglobus vestalii]TQO19670.1 hypothetical protein FB472_1241 [Rhodoglobus vestalii]
MANSQEETFALVTVSTTLSTRVSVGRKSEQLAGRALELGMYGDMGFQLLSTLKIEGEVSITILDTLQRRKTE